MVHDYDFILELRRIQNELNRIFEQFLGRAEGAKTFAPGCNIVTCPDTVRVYFDLPGTDLASLRVAMVGDNLIVEGIKKRPDETARLRPIRLEREYGAFFRTVQIPCPVNPHAARGYWQAGLLIVELPRVKERRRRKIEIAIDPPAESKSR